MRSSWKIWILVHVYVCMRVQCVSLCQSVVFGLRAYKMVLDFQKKELCEKTIEGCSWVGWWALLLFLVITVVFVVVQIVGAQSQKQYGIQSLVNEVHTQLMAFSNLENHSICD